MLSNQQNEKNGKIKRIKVGDSPIGMAFGGSEASKDTKLMFTDKQSGRHLTLRVIDEKNGKVVLDFHLTNEKEDSHQSLMKIIIDVIAMKRDEEKVEKQMLTLRERVIIPFKDEAFLKDKILVPIVNSGLIMEKRAHKTMFLDSDKLMELIGVLKGTEDLEQAGIDRAFVQAGVEQRGTLLRINGSWHYLEFAKLYREIGLLLEPYLTFEGITKEQFLTAFKPLITPSENQPNARN